MAGNDSKHPTPSDKAYGITNIESHIPLLLDLDRLNYDAWRDLFMTHCIGFDVLDHIDKSFLYRVSEALSRLIPAKFTYS